jgi:hypothetical protein
MRRLAVSARVALVVLSLAAALPARAEPPAHRLGAQFRYGSFSNDNDLRDVLAYWAGRHAHVQLEYWDFVRGEDQFRPEVGVHFRDARRSTYLIQWRHEKRRERYTFGTDQVLGGPWVGRLEASPIVGEGRTDWVLSGGFDFYWRSYNFAQVTLIRDPRSGGLWVLPMRVRLANERNDWVQFGVAPASERTWGWSADAKLHVVRFGIERNSRYDFTDLDNVMVTLGVEYELPRP